MSAQARVDLVSPVGPVRRYRITRLPSAGRLGRVAGVSSSSMQHRILVLWNSIGRCRLGDRGAGAAIPCVDHLAAGTDRTHARSRFVCVLR